MNLPNAHLALIEPAKIIDYILNPAHPGNGGKASFFISRGFTAAHWDVLAQALRTMAASTPVASTVASPYGQKFVIDGDIDTPSGRRAAIRSVWIIDTGAANPRFVTAYPRD